MYEHNYILLYYSSIYLYTCNMYNHIDLHAWGDNTAVHKGSCVLWKIQLNRSGTFIHTYVHTHTRKMHTNSGLKDTVKCDNKCENVASSWPLDGSAVHVSSNTTCYILIYWSYIKLNQSLIALGCLLLPLRCSQLLPLCTPASVPPPRQEKGLHFQCSCCLSFFERAPSAILPSLVV